MSRLRLAGFAAAFVFLAAVPAALAQQGGVGQAAASRGVAGVQGSRAASQTGFGLSSRFQSNFGRFTGGSTQQTGGMVGAAAATAGTGVPQVTTGGVGGFNQGGGGLNAFNSLGGLGRGGFGGYGYGFGRNRNNMNTTQQQQQQQIRTRLSLGFTHSGVAPTLVAQRFESRLAKSSRIEAATPVRVTMEGSTAILQGTVASDHQRDLAQRLAMLEPGISDVRNELTVRPLAPTPAPPPTPNSPATSP